MCRIGEVVNVQVGTTVRGRHHIDPREETVCCSQQLRFVSGVDRYDSSLFVQHQTTSCLALARTKTCDRIHDIPSLAITITFAVHVVLVFQSYAENVHKINRSTTNIS